MASNESGAGAEVPQLQRSVTSPAPQQNAIEEQNQLIASLKEDLAAYKKTTVAQQEQIDAQGKTIATLQKDVQQIQQTVAAQQKNHDLAQDVGTGQQLEAHPAITASNASTSLSTKLESVREQTRAWQDKIERSKEEWDAFADLSAALAEPIGLDPKDMKNPAVMAARDRALAADLRRQKKSEGELKREALA